MADGLAFTLWAPLAAMGGIAVGEQRGGFDRPARSAIFGLVAAALGYDRRDEAHHAALESSYRLAQRVRARGTLLVDYHTVQSPAPSRKASWATRREALRAAKLETLISRRDYRADAAVDVVLIRIATAAPAVDVVAEALRRPVYTLYFGRKSCPLGLPLRPVCMPSLEGIGTLLKALDEASAACDAATALRLALILNSRTYPSNQNVRSRSNLPADNMQLYADIDLAGDAVRGIPDLVSPHFKALRVERRRDRVASRSGWRFELRDEIVAHPASGGES